MLNRIVYAIKVFNAFNFILTDDEWKQPTDPSEVETVIPWDWYWDDILAAEAAAAAAAPSVLFMSFNLNDLHSLLVKTNAFQSFANATSALSLGPWLLPLLSLLVGIFYLLGFRPFERLERLSGVCRCAVAMVILMASFLAVWTAPTVVIQSSVVALVIRVLLGLVRAGWDWIYSQAHKLVDLLCGLTGVFLFVDGQLNMVMLSGLVCLWAGGRAILYVERLCLPISWVCVVEWAWNSLTFPLVMNLRLVWWAIRNVSALVWMAVVAVLGAAVAGATANTFQTICGDFYKGRVQTVGWLSAQRVYDLVVSAVAPVPAASNEATVLQPVPVEAAPAVEIEVMQVEVSTVNDPVVSEVPVKARTKPKVPKGLVQPKSRRRIRPAPEARVESLPQRRSKRIADRGGR
jgi:hypothetical protein